MRVGLFVDALSPQLTGIGRYCWELATRLPNDPRIRHASYFVPSGRVSDLTTLLDISYRVRRPQRTLRALRGWTSRTLGFDALHSPNYFLPDWAATGIATIHDLSVFRYPETHPAERVACFESEFQKTLVRAEHLIVDCETIRREVVEFTGFDPSRVTAIPLGVSANFKPISLADRRSTLMAHGLPLTGYGLTVASLEPRKRIDRLIAAWRNLPGKLRDRFPLVVAGAGGWRNEQLKGQIADGASEGWLIPMGFIEEAELAAIYSGASTFVFPSLYEGFGLPPLEAMASGTPTIVASGSCLPEVTQGAAMIVDPDDVVEFSLSIQRALEDDVWREQASLNGLRVARGYTWQKCADETVALYARCAARR